MRHRAPIHIPHCPGRPARPVVEPGLDPSQPGERCPGRRLRPDSPLVRRRRGIAPVERMVGQPFAQHRRDRVPERWPARFRERLSCRAVRGRGREQAPGRDDTLRPAAACFAEPARDRADPTAPRRGPLHQSVRGGQILRASMGGCPRAIAPDRPAVLARVVSQGEAVLWGPVTSGKRPHHACAHPRSGSLAEGLPREARAASCPPSRLAGAARHPGKTPGRPGISSQPLFRSSSVERSDRDVMSDAGPAGSSDLPSIDGLARGASAPARQSGAGNAPSRRPAAA